MKRKTYFIELYKNDKLILSKTKYAWNTARREIPKMVKEQAVIGEAWELTDEYYAKNEFKEYIDGVQHWECGDNLIRATIELKD